MLLPIRPDFRMIKCQSCGRENLDRSQFCEECGSRLIVSNSSDQQRMPSYIPPVASNPGVRISNITSVGIPPLVENAPAQRENSFDSSDQKKKGSHSRLTIERGGSGTRTSRFPRKSHTSVAGTPTTASFPMLTWTLTIPMQRCPAGTHG